MFTELHFHDIIFGIFPKVGGMMGDAYDCWTNNSVGDIVDMLMQALEVSFTFGRAKQTQSLLTQHKGLAFIHGLNVAHRVRIS
jgi:hypothetical protein